MKSHQVGAVVTLASVFAFDRIFRLAASPVSPPIASLIWKSRRSINEVWRALASVRFPSSELRPFVTASYCHLAFERYYSVLSLLEQGRYGSATALMRMVIEASARGMWLGKCAKDEQIREFCKAGPSYGFPNFKDLKNAVAATATPQNPAPAVFAQFEGDAWRAINDFCHGGNIQLSRRLKAGQFKPNYSDRELMGLIFMATSALLLCSVTYVEVAAGLESPEMGRLRPVLQGWAHKMQPFQAAASRDI